MDQQLKMESLTRSFETKKINFGKKLRREVPAEIWIEDKESEI